MEWISCEDELPELNQKVLFVAKAEHGLKYMDGEIFAGKYDGNDFDVPMFSMPGVGIQGTHWMPLPDPPKIKIERKNK